MAACVRFLQCGGCRFGSPFWEGPERWITQRNQDLWQTFEAVLSLCRSEHIELLFLTGDLFEQDYVDKQTVERVARSLSKLKDTRIFITPGERDPFVMTSAYRLAVWPSNVHIFSSGISSVRVPSLNVTVYGAGWTAYQQELPVLEGFQATRNGTIPIMVLHAEMESINNSEGFIPILPEHVASCGLAYLGLGHQAGWSGIHKVGATVWADSGFLEARSSAESGPHGVILGKIREDSVQVVFRELGQRHYIEKTYTVQDTIENLSTKILFETRLAERQRDLFRIRLSGSSLNVQAAVDPLKILLADTFNFVDVVQTEDVTNSRIRADVVIPLDRTAGNWVGHHTLTQMFNNQLKERQENALNTETQEHWKLVMKIGQAALGQGRIDDEN